MKILTGYILKEFVKIFMLTLSAFVSLYLIIDVFENLDTMIEHNVRFADSLRFFLYKAPFIFYQVSPVAVLMATLLSLGIFAKYNEIVAALSSGISLLRLCIPFFACALVISGLNFVLNESIIPLANKKVMAIMQAMEGKDTRATFAQNSIWFRDNSGIYSIDYIEPQNGIMHGLTIYKMSDDFNIVKRVDAREAKWVDGKWLATGVRSLNFQGNKLLGTSMAETDIIPIAEKPEGLSNVGRLAEEMNFMELTDYIDKLEKGGYAAARYVVDLHSKISFPLVSVIMVMMGIPFALRNRRRGGMAFGAGMSIIIGFSYWVVSAINISLGYNGIIPPFLAAWLTNLVFATFGALMLTYVRQ